jgi:hypothetical protein
LNSNPAAAAETWDIKGSTLNVNIGGFHSSQQFSFEAFFAAINI